MAATTQKDQSMSEILRNAGKRALGGGTAGAVAMVVNVSSLMWMRTTVNYQCVAKSPACGRSIRSNVFSIDIGMACQQDRRSGRFTTMVGGVSRASCDSTAGTFRHFCRDLCPDSAILQRMQE